MLSSQEQSVLQRKGFKTHLSPDILHFCSQQGLLGYLTIAVNLIERCFPTLQELHPHRETAPETGEEWLRLDVTLHGEIDEILEHYDKYTDLWVSLVPWPECDKIQLSYDII